MEIWEPPPMTDEGKALVTGNFDGSGFYIYPGIFNEDDQAKLVKCCSELLENSDDDDRPMKPKKKLLNFRESILANQISAIQDTITTLVKKRILASNPQSAFVLDYPESSYNLAHRDSLRFGPTITGISLLSDAVLTLDSYQLDATEIERVQKTTGYQPVDDPNINREMSVRLPPGSVYIMSGYSRYEMVHEILRLSARRISITLRDFVNVVAI